MGDQVKGRSPKKLKCLIEFPNVVQVKEQVLCFNMILISSPLRVLHRVIHFGGNLGDKVSVLSPKKLKILIGSLRMSSESTCF